MFESKIEEWAIMIGSIAIKLSLVENQTNEIKKAQKQLSDASDNLMKHIMKTK